MKRSCAGAGAATTCRADRASPLFEDGVSCPACHGERSDKQRASARERNEKTMQRRLAGELIDRTRASRVLGAYRDVPAADREALVELLCGVSEMVCALPWLREMDLNPVIVRTRDVGGAVVVDARPRHLFVGEPGTAGTGHIPGALSLPYNELVDGATGLFQSPAAIIHWRRVSRPICRSWRSASYAGYAGGAARRDLGDAGPGDQGIGVGRCH